MSIIFVQLILILMIKYSSHSDFDKHILINSAKDPNDDILIKDSSDSEQQLFFQCFDDGNLLDISICIFN